MNDTAYMAHIGIYTNVQGLPLRFCVVAREGNADMRAPREPFANRLKMPADAAYADVGMVLRMAAPRGCSDG